MTAREPCGPGTVVDGKYEIVAELGRGGMARVWLGRDARLGKLWAVKEIASGAGDSPDGLRDAVLRQGAIDEAHFMKRLDHPAIPRVVDICDEGTATFVVMDFVNGRSLGRALRERHGPFPQDDVVAWALELCDVLAYLHALDPPVVYRDLKPDNVMVRDDGSLRLVDFGIAAELRDGATPGGGSGTPGYAAPEQLGGTCGRRADVYALGATIYSLASGHVPRPLGGAQVDFEMRPLRCWDPGLSEGLERIVWRATRADPDERYQSVLEMRYDLEHHEELTRAYRDGLRGRVRAFRRRAVASVAAAVAAAGCLCGAAALHEESYEELMHAASMASVEAAGGAGGVQGPSAAELAYGEAVACDPARIGAYERLLDTYKADLALTPDEASRWSALFAEHGRAVEGDAGYARLCFEAGVLHLCYYGGPSVGDALTPANARRSAEWFSRAVAAAEAGCELDEASLHAAGTYLVIAQFHDRVSQATYEGAGGADAYRELWDALSESVRSLSDDDEAVVRLRLYQVAFESLASPSYLRGFWRAGVTRAQAAGLLEELLRRTRLLADDVLASEEALGPLYREIVEGERGARENLAATYGNPAAIAGRAG